MEIEPHVAGQTAHPIDREWLRLLLEARDLGIPISEIRTMLRFGQTRSWPKINTAEDDTALAIGE